jgi:hypothetical protein
MTKDTMRAVVCASGLAFCVVQNGMGATTVEVQVSPALQETWGSSIIAAPGDSIDIRVRVSYTGTQAPLGLGEFIFQPTLSHWIPTKDIMAPLVNNGLGGQHTTPIGAVADAPGQYGRVMPYAVVGMSATSFLRGHVNDAGGTTYLRIAQNQVTSWIGGAGNTTGGSGVNLRQWNVTGGGRSVFPDPPFSSALTDIVVFKFGVTLGAGTGGRVMVADAPLGAIWSQAPSIGAHVGWYGTPDEVAPSIRALPTVLAATITVVPAPGVGVLGLAGTALLVRRRRR